MAYGLLMSLPVGVDVRADVRDLGAILETGRDRVEDGVTVGINWLWLGVGHGGKRASLARVDWRGMRTSQRARTE